MTMLDLPPSSQDPRRASVFARAVFRHLREQGYTRDQIIGVSTELLSLLSTEIKQQEELAPAE